MLKRKTLFIRVCVLILPALFLTIGIAAGVSEKKVENSIKPEADLIYIDAMKTFGDLERPAVLFRHDLHTEALKKKDKDCKACHLSEKDKRSLRFKRLKDQDKQDVMDAYHLNCIECHKEINAAREKSGPEVCGECHVEKPEFRSSRLPMGFDKSLHFRHSKARKEKCEDCHHEYNEKTKKLFYAKEKEGTCRYCHKDIKEENRISMRMASHLSCIDCHEKTAAKKRKAGPINCSGCHDQKARKAIEKVDPVPRIKRKQPDLVLVKTEKVEEKGKDTLVRMNRVPFDHKSHENYNDNCRVCHHEDLKSCSECHTIQGNKEGKNIKLGQAMHRLNADMSCIGCHEVKQRNKDCAGCHAGIEKHKKQEKTTCKTCHMNPLEETTGMIALTDEKIIADELLRSREAIMTTYSDNDIPEKVIIKSLSKKYKPVEFPHRKIVKTLGSNIKDNKLTQYFHQDKGVLCQGCHHSGPVTKKPPSCGSCHGKPFDEMSLFTPGLMGAYHIQCMDCHKEMELEKPVGCTDCHKERK